MSLAALLLTGLAGAGVGQASFDEVVSLVREERHAAALQGARALADGLERARAETWVRYQAGDLAGAFEAARGGLEQAPEDAWLLSQAAELALSLGAAQPALELSERLGDLEEGLLRAAGLEEDRVADLRAQAEVLGQRRRAADRALDRARRVVLVVVLLLLVGIGLGLRGGAPASGGPPGE